MWDRVQYLASLWASFSSEFTNSSFHAIFSDGILLFFGLLSSLFHCIILMLFQSFNFLFFSLSRDSSGCLVPYIVISYLFLIKVCLSTKNVVACFTWSFSNAFWCIGVLYSLYNLWCALCFLLLKLELSYYPIISPLYEFMAQPILTFWVFAYIYLLVYLFLMYLLENLSFIPLSFPRM